MVTLKSTKRSPDTLREKSFKGSGRLKTAGIEQEKIMRDFKKR